MLLLVTPILGSLRNHVKYKNFKPIVFVRTPIIYFFLFIFLQMRNIWKIIVFERWFMFIYKTSISIYKNDYKNKKEKYIRKYKMKYD